MYILVEGRLNCPVIGSIVTNAVVSIIDICITKHNPSDLQFIFLEGESNVYSGVTVGELIPG